MKLISRAYILLGLLFYLGAVPLFSAQPPDLYFSHISANSSLSNPYVSVITQDSIGYLWIGTGDGVNRFDGHEVVVYKAYDGSERTGLVSGRINDLFVDSKDRVWVGTPIGISIYDRELDRFKEVVSPYNFNGVENIEIENILEDVNGQVVTVSGTGIYGYDEAKETFVHLFSAGDYNISTIVFGENNDFWLGFDGGQGIAHYPSYNAITPDFFLPAFTADMEILKMLLYEGDLWVALGDEGILVVDTDAKKVNKRYFHLDNRPYIATLSVDRSNRLWAVDYTGIKLYQPESDTFYGYYNIPDEDHTLQLNVADVFEDRQGNFYTIHKGSGVFVSYFRVGFQLFNTSKYSYWHTSSADISAVTEDGEGNLWLGFFSGGIDVFKWQTGETIRFAEKEKGLGQGTVIFLFSDSKGNVWTSTYRNGLNRFNPFTQSFDTWVSSEVENSLTHNDVRTMVEDSLGNFWLGTHGGGLDYFDVQKNEFTNYTFESHELTSNWVNDLLIDNKNRLWIATSYGLSLKEGENAVFKQYIPMLDQDGGLKGDDVLCLLQDKAGTIWAGTNQGLFYYIEDEEIFALYEEVPVNYITSLEVDQNGDLWVGSNEGLLKLNLATKNVNQFDDYDGLQGLGFNLRASYFNGIGTLAFAGKNGVNLFNPDKLVFNEEPPTLRFSRFLLFNTVVDEYGDDKILKREINSLDEIVLNYGQNFFTIEFAAFNFTNPTKNRYACKLEGFDKEWLDWGNKRSISYTNLFPGKYTFRVKGSNNYGVWNEEGISIVIRVLPPWWLSVWFFVILAVAIFVALMLLYRLRTRSLRLRSARLAELVSEQTARIEKSNLKLRERTRELNKSNQILEERQATILKQAAELKEQAEELKRNNEELLKLIAARDKLFSIIAHDLRSPFNTILGFTGLLTEAFDEKEPERMKQYARFIHDSSISVFNLLENLLFWARSQSNQIQFSPFVSQLDEIVEDSLSLIRESAVKKNQTIDASKYHNYVVYMDVDMMRSVTRNLLINAIKFTPEKGMIKVSSYLKEGYAVVEISDTGVGMSQKDIERLYNHLSIDSSPGTSGEKGAGLGLSLSQEFVHINGGEMIVESTPGKGSTFRFTVPTKPPKKSKS